MYKTECLKSPRDALIHFINMNMRHDSRVSIRLKADINLMACANYVAYVEGCTQHRAIAAVSAMGCGVLHRLDKIFLDNDIYEECRKNIIPSMMLSSTIMSKIITNAIKYNDLLMIDGSTISVWMWDDVYSDMYEFVNRYYTDESSLANYIFWLGLDKLISCEELYSGIIVSDSSGEVIRHIKYAKTIVNEINGFYASIYDLSIKGHLFRTEDKP